MSPNRELLDIDEIGNLASFTPAEGLARIKAPALVEKRRWSMLRRLAPVTALSTMAWGAAATAVLVGALVFHAAPGKTPRPTPPTGAAVVAPSTAPTLAPATVNPLAVNSEVTPGPTSSPRAGNVTPPTQSAVPGVPTAVPPPTPADLLSNSSFESPDLSGYGPWQSTATRVTSPVESGSYALKIAQLSTSDTWFTIDSWAQVVNAVAGTTYTASVYVAAPTAWVGRTVQLVLRESVHDVNHTNQRLWVKNVTLTSAYQLVQVSGQADANDTVSVYVGPPSSQHAGAGEYFYADVLTLTAG